MKWLVALFCGALFGAGLAISDMMNPARVLAFLDVAGAWDPSLALVMASALVPSALGYLYARKRGHTVLGDPLQIPPRGPVDMRLLAGAAIFGIGWGLAGLCPGPAIAALTVLDPRFFLFVIAMLIGMALQGAWQARPGSRGDRP